MTQPTAVQLRLIEAANKLKDLTDRTQAKTAIMVLSRLGLLAAAEPAPEPQGGGEKRWPFVESPGEFTERLHKAMQEFPLIGAVRHVLIENPPALTPKPSTPQADGEGDDDETPEPTVMQIEYARGYGDGIRDAERIAAERAEIATSKAPAEVTCTCPSGDGSLRWPCPKHPPSGDANVDAVCSLLYARSRKGVKEYGVNTERPDFGRDDWLRELQTELLDGAVYVQAALAALRPTSTTRAGEGK